MNFYQASKYLEYLVFSGHRKGHGIHSPFIFDIVSKIFRNKTQSEIVCKIEKIRKKLLHNQKLINVNDLGAGQYRNSSKTRKVSDIAKYSAVPQKYGILLSNLAAEFGSHSIIELGTSLGISAMYLAASCPEGRVYSVEGCGECAELAKENLEEAGFLNVNVINASFDSVLPGFAAEGIKPGMVFIDGNHRKEPTLRYFEQLAEISGEKTVFVIDDIYYSREMSEAWTEIKHSANVSATIDIFRMGIVFLNRNVTRNHYKIRY